MTQTSEFSTRVEIPSQLSSTLVSRLTGARELRERFSREANKSESAYLKMTFQIVTTRNERDTGRAGQIFININDMQFKSTRQSA
jgi:hypothetical protein